jgi:hypothetical protein
MKSRAPHPGGVAMIMDPALPRGLVEMHTATCRHCNRVIIVPVGQRIEDVSGGCRNCWGLICLQCVAAGVCTPFMKWVEQMEERYYRRKQLDMLGY